LSTDAIIGIIIIIPALFFLCLLTYIGRKRIIKLEKLGYPNARDAARLLKK
jgi:hypothetical protein